jgi:hypothetical protein
MKLDTALVGPFRVGGYGELDFEPMSAPTRAKRLSLVCFPVLILAIRRFLECRSSQARSGPGGEFHVRLASEDGIIQLIQQALLFILTAIGELTEAITKEVMDQFALGTSSQLRV